MGTEMMLQIVIQLVGPLLVWLVIQRTVSRRDTEIDALKGEVRTLRENEVAHIAVAVEKNQQRTDERLSGEAAARKKIHEDMTWIRTHFVHVEQCQKAHQQLTAQLERFQGAVIDLARVEAGVKGLADRIEGIGEQLIGVTRDVARMEGARG